MGPRLIYPLEEVANPCKFEQSSQLSLDATISPDVLDRRTTIRSHCIALLSIVRRRGHFHGLNNSLATLLPDSLGSQGPKTEKKWSSTVLAKTEDMISRLPATPRRFYDLPIYEKPPHLNKLAQVLGGAQDLPPNDWWLSEYVLPGGHPQPRPEGGDRLAHLRNSLDIAWSNLWVTAFIDKNSTVLALLIASMGTTPDLTFATSIMQYVNTVAELLEMYSELSNCGSLYSGNDLVDLGHENLSLASVPWHDDVGDDRYAKQELQDVILEIYLWTAWQRSAMLLFYYVVGVQIVHGTHEEWSKLLAIKGAERLDDLRDSNADQDSLPQYICSWAFEILRTHRSSVLMDFRHLLSRLASHFTGRVGRCIPDSAGQCQIEGTSPCWRFVESESKSQTIHDVNCDRSCSLVIWDEHSYRQIPDARAVDIKRSGHTIVYTAAGSQTLAISHVWSHGQGGRPEFGINSCLHARYCRLAMKLQCQSYWIDAACIPSEKTLRLAALETINDVFKQSKATLIIDVDLMSVSVEEFPKKEVEIAENLLSILLVCDWNVRGWTMLEAMRGSQSLHILCQGDRVVRVQDILLSVYNKGAIALATLLGSAQHLLPPTDDNKSAEEAGSLLSRRHVSKSDDEIVIWGLLCGIQVQKSAAQFWKTQQRVRTAFLMSSAPRVADSQTMSWAPATPYVRTQGRIVELDVGISQRYTVRFPAYDGIGSAFAKITEAGLVGPWRFMEIHQELLDRMEEIDFVRSKYGLLEGDSLEFEDSVEAVRSEDVVPFEAPDEANAHLAMLHLVQDGARVRFLRPVSEDLNSPYVGAADRGERIGLIGAICASFNSGDTWQWRCVHQLQEPEEGEAWSVAEMIIV